MFKNKGLFIGDVLGKHNEWFSIEINRTKQYKYTTESTEYTYHDNTLYCMNKDKDEKEVILLGSTFENAKRIVENLENIKKRNRGKE